MKKNVVINIRGVQRQGEDNDSTELITIGHFFKKDDKYFIAYEESDMSGFKGCNTVVSIDPKKVSMNRYGQVRNTITVEKGVRHQSRYSTGYGDITVGVMGSDIKLDFNDNGGELHMSYTLDINTSLASENEIHITVKEQQERDV